LRKALETALFRFLNGDSAHPLHAFLHAFAPTYGHGLSGQLAALGTRAVASGTDMQGNELIEDGIRCEQRGRVVDEFTAIAERWGYWSDGCGELLPFCPECARREFAPDALASVRLPLVPGLDASSSGS